VTAFRNKLNTFEYKEATDYVLLIRWGEGNFDRFSDYARELVEAKPDVILVIGTAVATAVKGQTSTIPAIFVQVADPIGGGL
jgi:putative ABC transport system substrate-binding protein